MTILLRTPITHPGAGSNQGPTHRDLVLEMASFAKVNSVKGGLLFIADYLMFWGAIAGVLLLPDLALKVLASVIAGVKLANLVTLAHDAAHNSLTASRSLNRVIAVLAFLPALFNYRLWMYDHHVLHHPHTNGQHVDSYQPLSKADYDALPAQRRAWYRFIRSGNPLSFGLYYITQRWWQVKFLPRAFLPQALRASAWKHSAFLLVYATSFIGLLLAAPEFAPVSPTTAVLLGFVLPFFIFQSLLASSLYINHTHPDIAWFNASTVSQVKLPAEALTLHLRFPAWFAGLAHHFYEHPAHHIYPAIPCYELGRAQAHLNRLLGARALVVDFSLPAMADIFRKCKLYDYENHRWLDYQGTPTTPVVRAILEATLTHSPSRNLVKEG